jgi:hypothetical protein
LWRQSVAWSEAARLTRREVQQEGMALRGELRVIMAV